VEACRSRQEQQIGGII
jgi:hypothetical protein